MAEMEISRELWNSTFWIMVKEFRPFRPIFPQGPLSSRMDAMKKLMLMPVLLILVHFGSGCSGSLGFGDENGVGLRGTVAKDGKVFAIETADGEGNIK
jgi:hypothetical protein